MEKQLNEILVAKCQEANNELVDITRSEMKKRNLDIADEEIDTALSYINVWKADSVEANIDRVLKSYIHVFKRATEDALDNIIAGMVQKHTGMFLRERDLFDEYLKYLGVEPK